MMDPCVYFWYRPGVSANYLFYLLDAMCAIVVKPDVTVSSRAVIVHQPD